VIRRVTTGDEQGIELFRLHLVDSDLGLRRHLALLPFQLLSRLEPDDRDAMPRLLESVIWLLELRVLKITVEETGNPHSDTSLGRFFDTDDSAYRPIQLIVKLKFG
jgi:hypothetical protein